MTPFDPFEDNEHSVPLADSDLWLILGLAKMTLDEAPELLDFPAVRQAIERFDRLTASA